MVVVFSVFLGVAPVMSLLGFGPFDWDEVRLGQHGNVA